MNKAFIEDNKDRYYFNLQEILRQSSPSYDHKKFKDYNDPYSDNYKKNAENIEAIEYIEDLRKHCTNERKKVKKVLQNLFIDLNEFKTYVADTPEGKNMHKSRESSIPFIIAELIYVILTDLDISKTVSRLKTGNLDSLTFEEGRTLKLRLLKEIESDCKVIAEGHESMEQIERIRESISNDVTYQKAYELLDRVEQQIVWMKRMIKIPYFDNRGKVAYIQRALSGQGTEVQNSVMEQLKYDIELLDCSSMDNDENASPFYYGNNWEKFLGDLNSLFSELPDIPTSV